MIRKRNKQKSQRRGCCRLRRVLVVAVASAATISFWSLTHFLHTTTNHNNNINNSPHSNNYDVHVSSLRPDNNDPEAPCNRTLRYKGILLITRGDRHGAAGTIFYLFVLNQLLYAQRHQLLPWIHLDNYSRYIFDEAVHNGNHHHHHYQAGVTTNMIVAAPWDATLPAGLGPDGCPPAPPGLQNSSTWRLQRMTLPGNGVFSSYFDSSATVAPNSTCRRRRPLPVVRLTADQILHGLHLRCPYTVRAWRYGGTSAIVKQLQSSSGAIVGGNDDYDAWFAPQRARAAAVVQRYYKWQPALRAAIQAVLPPKDDDDDETMPYILGLHVRHSDKANQRRRIAVREFIPYLQVYWQLVPHGFVYLATDSELVVQELHQVAAAAAATANKNTNQNATTSSTSTPNTMIYTQPNVLRATNTSAVFALTEHHHRTNWQVLVDIGALAHCTWMLHGLSAVSEAALYHNPALQSFNLELASSFSFTRQPSAQQQQQRDSLLQKFERQVRETIVTNNMA